MAFRRVLVFPVAEMLYVASLEISLCYDLASVPPRWPRSTWWFVRRPPHELWLVADFEDEGEYLEFMLGERFQRVYWRMREKGQEIRVLRRRTGPET